MNPKPNGDHRTSPKVLNNTTLYKRHVYYSSFRFRSGAISVLLDVNIKGETCLVHRRSVGKLEAKLARNFCHLHLETRRRDNNPDEITETIFTGKTEELNAFVLAEAAENRTGIIPDYPTGLVCFDSQGKGFFDLVRAEDEVSV